MRIRRWGLAAIVIGLGAGTFVWLRAPRPDDTFVVLGEATRIERVVVAGTSVPTEAGVQPGRTISNAFVDSATEPMRAGRYSWTSTAYEPSGALQSRHARFREGPWTEIDAQLVERSVRDALGCEVVSYRVWVRGAITADGAQWLFDPELSASWSGRSTAVTAALRFDALARQLELEVVESFGGDQAHRYRVPFVVDGNGAVRRLGL